MGVLEEEGEEGQQVSCLIAKQAVGVLASKNNYA